MSKFQEGDKVRFIGNSLDFGRGAKAMKYGDEAHIKEVRKDHNHPVDNPAYTIDRYGTEWDYREDELELVESSQTNMSDFQPFYVEVDGPQHSRMLQEIAFEEGFEWFSAGEEIKLTDKNILNFETRGDITWGESNFGKELKDFSLEEFRQALNGEYRWEDPIEVGDYEVEFHDDEEEITIGCFRVSYEQVMDIYRLVGELGFKISHYRLDDPISVGKIHKIYQRITD